jgi:DNA modification methylase
LPVDQLAYERLPVDSLSTFDGNPRKGNVEKIAASLERHGQYRPIVVNAGSETGRGREVLAGNHTLMAARSLGWSHVDACLVDVDDETAKSIVAADNKLADLGGYDDLALFSLLDSLEDLGATGYTISELEALRQDLFPPEVLTDPDEAPSVPADPISELGQVWQLGKHRLLVGDSTDLEAVRALVGDEPPDCVWTDPPYGVEYVGKTKDALTIQNDGSGGLPGLLAGAFTVVAEVCLPGAPVYVACPPGPEFRHFCSAFVEGGLLWRQTLAWVKNTMVLGRSDYHYKHETILYGFVPADSGRLGRGGERWHGDNSQTTVFPFDKPSRSAEHPTMKPVALIDAMIKNSLPPGGIVFDPFGGSGSTLIAAHDRGCRAFLVELDPRYADVILHRYEAHTGDTPTLDGEPVSFVKAET